MMCSWVSTRAARFAPCRPATRNHGHGQDGAHVQLGRHLVHRHASKLAASVDGALVRAEDRVKAAATKGGC